MRPSYVIFEDAGWQNFLPLAFTRAVFQLFCGTGSLVSKIQRVAARPPRGAAHQNGRNGHSGSPGEAWCRRFVAEVVAEQTQLPVNRARTEATLFVNGRGAWSRLPEFRPEEGAWIGVAGKKPGIACIAADAQLASRLSPVTLLDEAQTSRILAGVRRRDVSEYVKMFEWPWEVVLANEALLVSEHSADCWGGTMEGVLSEGSYLLGRESVHIGTKSRIKPGVVIDAEDGPVWIGDNVTILPHSYVQGPAYIGDGCLLQPATVVHAGCSIGPVCKIGGEIEASIFQGFANKQHNGYLGHSYVGSWVNIAADCINSDLKNTYGSVRVPINGQDVDTGETFVGALIGDYSKLGINVSIATGAVIGFCSNVFAPRCPKFVPSFTWIDGDSVERFDEERGLSTARKVMARRNREMSVAEERAFLAVRPLALALENRPRRIETPRLKPARVFYREAVHQ